jgi:hypothetical protein
MEIIDKLIKKRRKRKHIIQTPMGLISRHLAMSFGGLFSSISQVQIPSALNFLVPRVAELNQTSYRP